MKKIYLIRHGQTPFNEQGIVQGSGVNGSLNERGEKQAKAFYENYKGIPFDKIYTSKLTRSIESVQAFINQGIPWVSSEKLNEISWGDYDGKQITNDDYYWGVVKRWHEGETNLRPSKGESPEDVIKRLRPIVQEIKDSTDENILICMHGRAMRILLTLLTDQPLVEMQNFPHHNLGLYLLEYKSPTFTIFERNNMTHLKHDADLIVEQKKYN